MLEKVRGAGVTLQLVHGQLMINGQMTAPQRAWIQAHKADLIAALQAEEIACATCGHRIDLGIEEWRYRLADGEPLCQRCCEQADAEFEKWEAKRDARPTLGR